jgi:hypothetical protein
MIKLDVLLKNHAKGTGVNFHRHAVEDGKNVIKDLEFDHEVIELDNYSILFANIPLDYLHTEFDIHYQREIPWKI